MFIFKTVGVLCSKLGVSHSATLSQHAWRDAMDCFQV